MSKGRRLRCRICGEKWAGRWDGFVIDFYDKHTKLHGLEEPEIKLDENIDDFLLRVEAFRREYFEDSILEIIGERIEESMQGERKNQPHR
jgi:hypothetical protein